MAASRHPWLETEPKYHVNSRPLDLTIKKIYCLDHSVKAGRNMSIIPIVDKIRSLSIIVDTNQSTNIGNR